MRKVYKIEDLNTTEINNINKINYPPIQKQLNTLWKALSFTDKSDAQIMQTKILSIINK